MVVWAGVIRPAGAVEIAQAPWTTVWPSVGADAASEREGISGRGRRGLVHSSKTGKRVPALAQCYARSGPVAENVTRLLERRAAITWTPPNPGSRRRRLRPVCDRGFSAVSVLKGLPGYARVSSRTSCIFFLHPAMATGAVRVDKGDGGLHEERLIWVCARSRMARICTASASWCASTATSQW